MLRAGRSRAAALARPSAVLLAASGVAFALVAADVVVGGPVSRADPHVAHWSFARLPDAIHPWLRRTTHLGDAAFLGVLVLAAFAWLAVRRRRFDAVLLAAAAATTGLVTTGLKEAFRRSRPVYVDPEHGPHSFSFPSGHASGAFVVYTVLALLLADGRGTWARTVAMAAALAVATLVAATRVLLPVHYLSDVIAGAAVGLAAFAAVALARPLAGRAASIWP